MGKNLDWKGPVTPSGVWGECFVDTNKNGRWDDGEPFTADPVNTAIDPKSASRYSGIYLAGFGDDRLSTGMHDDLWARAYPTSYGTGHSGGHNSHQKTCPLHGQREL